MSLFSKFANLRIIVGKSLRQHALSTTITVISTALGVGLVMATFNVSTQSRNAFAGGPVGFDAVLGARGSQLQLVLNTVFHLETSPGNLPWSLYETVREHPGVELAIPYVVGDNFNGFRIVGTTEELFTDFEYQAGESFQPEAGGRFFDPLRREAVIGASVASATGLGLGDRFSPYHGVRFQPNKQHKEEYVIVGVLEPTRSPSDRVIWIPLEGLFRMGGHFLRGAGEEYVAQAGVPVPDEHKEVSAVMLKFKHPQVGFMLGQTINFQGDVATLAFPIASVMADLFEKLGWMSHVLELVAILVVVVAVGAILASLYNTMNERRTEFAILRALGARRSTVFTVILMESSAIAALGSLVGYMFYAAILGSAAWIVRRQTGVVLDVWSYHPVLLWMPACMVFCGALAGLLPAREAYSTDVADTLS
ncbi:MAG: putative ABC transport system permease protein [Planctomycetota bacterium]|jgi:putative ABC transport system permease protein